MRTNAVYDDLEEIARKKVEFTKNDVIYLTQTKFMDLQSIHQKGVKEVVHPLVMVGHASYPTVTDEQYFSILPDPVDTRASSLLAKVYCFLQQLRILADPEFPIPKFNHFSNFVPSKVSELNRLIPSIFASSPILLFYKYFQVDYLLKKLLPRIALKLVDQSGIPEIGKIRVTERSHFVRVYKRFNFGIGMKHVSSSKISTNKSSSEKKFFDLPIKISILHRFYCLVPGFFKFNFEVEIYFKNLNYLSDKKDKFGRIKKRKEKKKKDGNINEEEIIINESEEDEEEEEEEEGESDDEIHLQKYEEFRVSKPYDFHIRLLQITPEKLMDRNQVKKAIPMSFARERAMLIDLFIYANYRFHKLGNQEQLKRMVKTSMDQFIPNNNVLGILDYHPFEESNEAKVLIKTQKKVQKKLKKSKKITDDKLKPHQTILKDRTKLIERTQSKFSNSVKERKRSVVSLRTEIEEKIVSFFFRVLFHGKRAVGKTSIIQTLCKMDSKKKNSENLNYSDTQGKQIYWTKLPFQMVTKNTFSKPLDDDNNKQQKTSENKKTSLKKKKSMYWVMFELTDVGAHSSMNYQYLRFNFDDPSSSELSVFSDSEKEKKKFHEKFSNFYYYHGHVVVFSMTDKKSFEVAKKMVTILKKKKLLCILVGTKIDCYEKHQISKLELENICKNLKVNICLINSLDFKSSYAIFAEITNLFIQTYKQR